MEPGILQADSKSAETVVLLSDERRLPLHDALGTADS
jgi:hypothetical protein